MKGSRYWIDALALVEHPQAGYYREVYRSSCVLSASALPAGFGGDRAACTDIYYLLERGQFGALHRLKSDEMWHFYQGDALKVHVITTDGEHSFFRLGPDPDAGEVLLGVVPAGAWFGSCLEGDGSYALVGCTVSPGFDFEDSEMGERDQLIRQYPQHAAVIEALTKPGEAGGGT